MVSTFSRQAAKHNQLLLEGLSKFVIASEAKQSIDPRKERMDCFVATLLAMTDLRRRLLRREAPIESLALGSHVFQKLRRSEARAVFGFELVTELDELPGAHEVDIGQRAAGERREAEAE